MRFCLARSAPRRPAAGAAVGPFVVACPFKARVVGEEVEVRSFDWDGSSQGIVAICRRKGRHYRVNVTALEWSGRPPTGAIWFDAYRAWLRGAW